MGEKSLSLGDQAIGCEESEIREGQLAQLPRSRFSSEMAGRDDDLAHGPELRDVMTPPSSPLLGEEAAQLRFAGKACSRSFIDRVGLE